MLQAKIAEALWGPAPSKKQQIKVKFWIWDPMGHNHRKIILQDGKRQVANSSSVTLNLTAPCRTVPCQYHGWGMPGWQAGSLLQNMREYNAKSKKQDRQRFKSFVKTIFLSFYYLSMAMTVYFNVTWAPIFFNHSTLQHSLGSKIIPPRIRTAKLYILCTGARSATLCTLQIHLDF